MAVEFDTLAFLGAGKAFKVKESNLHELWRVVDRGLPAESVDFLIAQVPAHAKKPTEKWILVQVKPTGKRLDAQQSSTMARLAYILALSKDVWGSQDESIAFLLKEHPQLDNKQPLDAASTEWGAREVESLLRKIQFGLPV